jgi:acyl transferase domain-containing protein
MYVTVTYEYLESAGITKEKIKGTQTGVFMGVCWTDYYSMQTMELQEIRPYSAVCLFFLIPFFFFFFFFVFCFFGGLLMLC